MFVRGLLLLLLTFVACWPTWSLPDLDGTEGRRVQIALEMLQNGDWLVPSLGQQPTWAKPPLHYWILVACQQWFGGDWFGMRLPSVVGAWLAAWLAGELLRTRFGAFAGWIGALGIACSPLVAAVWPNAEIDPLFAVFTASSLWCLACGAAEHKRGLVLVSGVLAGLAMLQKGPPFFLFAAGAYIALCRDRRVRHLPWHLLPMLLVALAYYVPLWTLRVKPGEMFEIARDESVGRFLLDWEHIKPIPAYWVRALAVQLPFLLWLWSGWRERGGPANTNDIVLRACRWGGVLAIVALTFSAGRPTRYLQPNILLLTFAAAPAVAWFARSSEPLSVVVRRLLLGLGFTGAVALIVLPFVDNPNVGVGALAAAGASALGAAMVCTRLHLVVLCLVLPVVGVWGVQWERSLTWLDNGRARAPWGELLRREMDRAGVTAGELATMGHFDSPLLLAMGYLPPGDENARGDWRQRWVLHERVAGTDVSDPPLSPPANYVARLRLDLPLKSFVLRERVGDGK